MTSYQGNKLRSLQHNCPLRSHSWHSTDTNRIQEKDFLKAHFVQYQIGYFFCSIPSWIFHTSMCTLLMWGRCRWAHWWPCKHRWGTSPPRTGLEIPCKSCSWEPPLWTLPNLNIYGMIWYQKYWRSYQVRLRSSFCLKRCNHDCCAITGKNLGNVKIHVQRPRPRSYQLPPFRSYTRKISPRTKTNGKRFQRKLLQPYIVAVTELHKFTVG